MKPEELSGKISWPNDATNSNFAALMVHESMQGKDFAPLRIGDPLFVDLDGTIWFVVESDEIPRGGYQEVEVEDSYD